MKTKYWELTHKYEIRVSKNVGDAKRIDKNNGNTLWLDSIRLEMKDNRIAFEEHDGNPDKLI